MKLYEFFKNVNKCALGYSGGVDSAFLLYFALKQGVDIQPYFVRSVFTTDEECFAAVHFAESLGCKVVIINADVLASSDIKKNSSERCYFCKKLLFESVLESAKNDGYDVVIEGTNASDDIDDRPGFRAITELGVVSPLKLCGITKDEIRTFLKNERIELWNRPATACLATRIPFGTEIIESDLFRVRECEKVLCNMGFSDFRVRLFHDAARIQLKPAMFRDAAEKHAEIYNEFKRYFSDVFLDFKER